MATLEDIQIKNFRTLKDITLGQTIYESSNQKLPRLAYFVTQRGFKLLRRSEPGLIDQLGDTSVKALDHPIGLRVARRGQPVLDTQLIASQVKGMLPGRLLQAAREAVCELTAVISEQFDDFHGRSALQASEEISTAGL